MPVWTYAPLRAVVCAVAIAFAAQVLQAQHYLFRQYSQPQGLKNLAIHCLLQDKAGFIWVGTDNGLYRFDGRSFTPYSTAQALPATQSRR